MFVRANSDKPCVMHHKSKYHTSSNITRQQSFLCAKCNKSLDHIKIYPLVNTDHVMFVPDIEGKALSIHPKVPLAEILTNNNNNNNNEMTYNVKAAEGNSYVLRIISSWSYLKQRYADD